MARARRPKRKKRKRKRRARSDFIVLFMVIWLKRKKKIPQPINRRRFTRRQKASIYDHPFILSQDVKNLPSLSNMRQKKVPFHPMIRS